MLQTLTVENFALVENITVEFGDGLNILTGETGAGKSILIDALGAVLGARINVNQIRTDADTLLISAKFSSGITITRKISRTEKNSISLNGKLITLTELKKLGATLVDIHGQHQSLKLLREENIYTLLNNEKISSSLKNFQQLFRTLKVQSALLEQKISGRNDNLQRLDFLRWQEQEISSAQLKSNEDLELEAEIKKLSHAERIVEHIKSALQLLNEKDNDILTALAHVMKNLDEVARYDDKLNSTRKLLDDAEISLREAYEEVRNYAEGLDFAPERLNELQERADTIFRLKQKYGASVNEILDRLEKIRLEISALENFDTDVSELQRNVATLESQTQSAADKLFKLRQSAAKTLSSSIEREIRRLGMDHAQFEIVIERTEKLSLRGGDTADIKFSANVGEEKLSLAKIISGGELSRIALAIKTVTADREASAPTMIFDEIDVGIGGITAKTVAEAIAKISRSRQVICVTHLAQIAAKADIHLNISKSESNGRTVTKIKRLDDEEHIQEIARMASGNISATSIKNAREIISGNN